MRRSRLILTIALLSIPAIIAIVVATRDDGAEEADGASGPKIELAGAKLSKDDVEDITKDAMGTSDLKDVKEAGPDEAAASMEGTLVGKVRTFSLEARPVRWEYRSGQRIAAWGYNGQVPGPVLRANEGETVKVEFRNELPVATTVHWHGIDVPWQQDGVPGVTQKAVEPGESFSYQFTATPAGTRWYHTHGSGMDDEASQIDMGLSGALVVRAKREVPADVDQVLVLDEWSIGSGGYNAAMLAGHGAHSAGSSFNVFTMNGRAAPNIEDVVVKKGDRVRLRFVNASSVSYHPMHVHGHQARVVALDGNPVPSPTTRNVELLAPGQTADIEFVADNPGVWMLHCHDLHHSTSGMSLLLRYEGYEPISDEHGGGDDDPADAKADGDDEDPAAAAGMEH
ncbi:MAG: hypothetical protein JWM90_2857 [Thermoleophilia bacterium]|nr:hypothetical protein [Thermoleophilia bacterium]